MSTTTLDPFLILGIIVSYFLLLILVSYFTGKDATNENFFLAGRKAPWYLVAFGMIGASLSGVTFISIPGAVGSTPELIEAVTGKASVKVNIKFSYMQMVFGYLVGYLVIATVLLPLYYRNNLTSIYGYLEKRFGFFSYKIGAFYFLLSRSIGAAFRLFLVAIVLQTFIMGPFGIPFWVTVMATILLIWVYTFRGGISTIVWTDTLQTLCMLIAVILTVVAIGNAFDRNFGELITMVKDSEYGQMFFFENGWTDPNYFWKQFISGALIAIVMTGLDQDMMQKNLSVRTLRDSQKNMFFFSIVLVFANLLFLMLGALLFLYSTEFGLPIPTEIVGVGDEAKQILRTDLLYPSVALNSLYQISPIIGITFILGLIAAAYSSADSALTSLTTSFCVDFLDFEKEKTQQEDQKRTRFLVHVGFSILLFALILIFKAINNQSVINSLFTAAGYTYGPLLGLYTFGLTTKLKVRDKWVILVCLIAPVLSYVFNMYSAKLLGGFSLGFLIILLNGLITFLGLLAISYYEVEEVDEHE